MPGRAMQRDGSELKRDIYMLIFILALFGFALWSIVPLDRDVFGRDGLMLGLDLKGGSYLVYEADLSEIAPDDRGEVMDGMKGVIERRINALGITEPIIQVQEQEGKHTIAIQLPGVSDVERAKELIGRVGILEFREQNEQGEWIPATGTVDGKELTLTSRYFKENTYVDLDQVGRPLLIFEWDETGRQLSEQITGRMIGKPLGIFLDDEPLRGEDGHPIAPIVRSVISSRGQIEGLSLADAQDLSTTLNYGRLPAQLGHWEEEDGSAVFIPEVPLYERTVDATLGADSVQKSLLAGAIGVALLLAFMISYYRVPGLIACLSLGVYGTLLLSIFKLFGITLTLPGVAAFILSLGMAVDANVLIFERMKEELRAGRTPGAAVEAGFNRAWTAIRDSNITTFIACLVLFWFGGALGAFMVRGFAITLFIGVALSMFTAIVVTRTFLRLILGRRLVIKPSAYGVSQ